MSVNKNVTVPDGRVGSTRTASHRQAGSEIGDGRSVAEGADSAATLSGAKWEPGGVRPVEIEPTRGGVGTGEILAARCPN
jgi:hypothetical protein